ncbi:inverse autotransporter beta domain-containing protein [Xenorhabdus bovienii]|uniref:inverse autotransporter beta domain-containing protein n=1 Tax=Xenorhabdus bovienii TaxID=40576 RepID=UPI0023B21027|nr:inverse autotransporter beta domain-containing protein [Xenorhabdus bovienii]MDE9555088.1 inverse autotransporter beta domain-containing protein [Xenorhabdus bovienii]
MLKEQSRQRTDKQRHRIKLVAWVNIFSQVVLLMAGTFTPVLAAAKTHPVAQEDRSLSKPMTKLEGEDETDLTKPLSSKALADRLRQISATEPSEYTTEPSENTTERWLASTASRAAGILKNNNIVDSAKRQLHGLAVNEANQAVQNWLQRYGTIKLQANVDDRGRLEGSQFDMLLPLYDREKQMAFTQFGLRRIDSRTTVNVGLGQRHFLNTGMFGYNAFVDHDITRDHTRFGIGTEYARDFMKFGASGYFRASGWKDGQKMKDYEERPANGFDLRAEGYIPAYPQLGGKLLYEQYFGDEVGLLSEERRQKNPSVFTVGASYTPIPLVTLGIDRKQSAQGHGETLVNFGLNYVLGTPWSKQIDPDAVTFKRSLQGGRYDLVERNNQIVLEYRKKELIRLRMEKQISGHGGQVMPLNVNVSSKYGLKEIVWDTANLVAGGGKLEKPDTPVRGREHYRLTLPPFHNKGNNTYILSGIAYDNQGNASERAETQIQVISLAIDLKGSGFELSHQSMAADGKTQTILRLRLIDNDGKPVSGVAGNITFISDLNSLRGEGKDPILGTEVKEVSEGSGIYEVTATAGSKPGEWKIIATVDDKPLKHDTEIQFDVANAPTISDLIVAGVIEQGKKLSATYQFNANGGNDTDHSFFAWGAESTTADKVTSLAKATGIEETVPHPNEIQNGITSSGNVKEKGLVPEYTIPQTAVGKVLELSVLASNAIQISHFPPETVVLRKGMQGNKTTGGNSEGGVTNPDAGPVITKLTLSGDLEVGKRLTATYQFDGNGGNDTDDSKYTWHDKNALVTDDQLKSIPAVSKDSKTKTGTLTRDLKQEDVGKMLAISVKPINGEGIAGQLRTVDTSMSEQDGNKTLTPPGDKPGSIFDPAGKPAINELKLEGILEKGKTLTAKYVFESGAGDVTDKSGYTWCRKQLNGQPDGTTCQAGTGPDRAAQVSEVDYLLEAKDVNRIVEFSIRAENALGVKADDTRTINTSMKWEEGNHAGGGNGQGSVIDPDKDPVITHLALIGPLAIGKKITATYSFDDNNGYPDDESLYAWGVYEPGEDDPTIQAIENSNDAIDKSGYIPESFELTDQHAGKIIALTVRPKNSKGNIGSIVRAQGTILGIPESFDVTWNVSTEEDLGNGKKAPKVKREDSITLTVKTLKSGNAIRGVPIKVELGKATGRAKTERVDPAAQLEIAGKTYKSGDTYMGFTDKNGELVITATDRNSIGLKTPVSITVNEGTGAKTETKTQDVIFTVITSPDTDLANYWGHMVEELPINAGKFSRPLLSKEVQKYYPSLSTGIIQENNEDWSIYNYQNVKNLCQARGKRIPQLDELQALGGLVQRKYQFTPTYGWPTKSKRAWYRSDTRAPNQGSHVKSSYALDTFEISKNGPSDMTIISCI